MAGHRIEPRKGICAPGFFGSELREAREQAGMSQGDLAARIPCDRSLIAHIELARRVPQENLVKACDVVLGTGTFLHRIWGKVGWYQEIDHPDWFRLFAEREAKATMVREYQPTWISGLLQTPAYARTLFSEGDAAGDPDLIKERLAGRLARQERFLGGWDAPLLIVVMDESALHRIVGGPEIMYEQLSHLLKLGRRPNIIIQIAPFSLGGRTLSNGGMTLLTFPGGTEWIYSESLNRGHFGNAPEQLVQRAQAYDRLRAAALSAPESARFIRRSMEGMLNMRPTRPDLTTAQWFKSSYTGSNGGQCVETAYNFAAEGTVPVRDSKNPTGPALLFSTASWRDFVRATAAGEFGDV
ncbi:Scr1 family TA system antitoxin-like transcriptional regulator [Kitasatospora sp. NPDC050543]|uniref:helix-turn-helix domain-containing protein n=1 Tax=Kitasatospora sp. NPDC050543 TaxID=3364054 RepID=UPI0037B9C3BD